MFLFLYVPGMKAFTADYTLYVMDVEARGLPVSVADGSKDVDQVGVPDWVYEGVCCNM